MNHEYRRDDYLICTDKARLNLDVIHNFLKDSYWAKEIPYDIVKKSVENSYCFGVYKNDEQIGFARIVSDFATFAYLADVFILEEHQGKGLSKWLMECIMQDPNLQNLRTFSLATWDAHSLYEKFGFKKIDNPEKQMSISNINIYKEMNKK
ncbi:MAG: GNAT family N-acetyltransferase [Ignavibacteriae bacterium]|jgi:N-acetylglutamate synthase-like GNAT family acetyltransferase|nr:N-acetyltransferase [Ignavibacteriota bacterium]NOG99566.1 GNAT family N-acetyltransferase [Ignavibacteriota bacterium]